MAPSRWSKAVIPGILLFLPTLGSAGLQRLEAQCRFESCTVNALFHVHRNDNSPPPPNDYVPENEITIRCDSPGFGYEGRARVTDTPNGTQIRSESQPPAILSLNPQSLLDLSERVPIFATLQIGQLIETASCQLQAVAIIPRYYLYMNGDLSSSGSISGFRIDPTTGALTPIFGSPFLSGTSWILDVVASSSGRAFVATQLGTKVHAGKILSNGQLKLTSTHKFDFPPGYGHAYAAAITPNDKFVYTMHPWHYDPTNGTIQGFSLSPTGVLTPLPGAPSVIGGGGDTMKMHPNGRFVYTVNTHAKSISGFMINPGTGALTPAYTIPTSHELYDMTFNAAGDLAYVTGSLGKIYGFRVNPGTGSFTHLPGSPFSSGTLPRGIAMDPLSRWVFTANRGVDNIFGFNVNPTTAALTTIPSSPFRSDRKPRAIVVDPTGSFVYTVNEESNSLTSYAIDPTTGTLSELPTSPMTIGYSPNAMTVTTRY